ncbi:MAG: tetrathionate reductase family octaheme c-type cytochrome [Propionivibrio sp.]|uniref:tetrathionate reductase family octaheme c-type cytochrome n=1 Tax=Propionivibrio sp. TaxID=2212460 RepID=UPI001A3E019D|nr:tetrathionate reductase family octaheme c-type cytochrome [Propionivibrio sp.]MBL8413517.1 tetrathionate reductase family octaheme c-type cytochrome [Propionivibrio sp.]
MGLNSLRQSAGCVLAVLLYLFSVSALAVDEPKPLKLTTTADHSKFKELQREFQSGPEVTKACLTCHTEAAGQIHRTKHWKWEHLNPDSGQTLGKKHILNNFCISIASNYSACTSCHIGYGWKDANFDFSVKENVDCLVCHDTTGIYKKPPGLAGNPVIKDMELPPGSGKIVKGIDITKVAQKVGKSSRDTCGACHFFGGGGDAVKHGDLDSSMAAPDRELDVHMDATGLDFTCATCHKTSSHDVAGSRYTPTAMDKGGAHIRGKEDNSNPATCVSCHGNGPHKKEERLNQHATKVACQTCHIPAFARGGVATKMNWDWSTAGERDAEGKQVVRKDDKGRVIYESRKGTFTLGENVKPEYFWFNGDVNYTLVTDKIEKSEGVIRINWLGGSPTDGKSLIWPVKVFRGSQPFDPINKTLVKPHTAGNDDTGYWKNLVWDKAVEAGMKDAGLPFSGQVDFVKTEMFWPITHMVAPKENALACVECHSKNGRLTGIQGVYIPGRDANKLIDTIGWGIALLALLGSLGHGLMLIAARRKHQGE